MLMSPQIILMDILCLTRPLIHIMDHDNVSWIDLNKTKTDFRHFLIPCLKIIPGHATVRLINGVLYIYLNCVSSLIFCLHGWLQSSFLLYQLPMNSFILIRTNQKSMHPVNRSILHVPPSRRGFVHRRPLLGRTRPPLTCTRGHEDLWTEVGALT